MIYFEKLAKQDIGDMPMDKIDFEIVKDENVVGNKVLKSKNDCSKEVGIKYASFEDIIDRLAT